MRLFLLVSTAVFSLTAARYIIIDPSSFVVHSKDSGVSKTESSSRPMLVKRGEFTIQQDDGSPRVGVGLGEDGGEGPQKGPPLLRTSLAVDRELSIFAGYVRNFASLEKWFDSKTTYTVVLAPTDRAVTSLPRKPWQFPRPITSTTPEDQQDSIARDNIQSFVEHHLHMGPLPTDSAQYMLEMQSGDVVNVNGDDVSIEDRHVHVSRRVKVSNGEIWVLDQSLVDGSTN